MDQAGNLTGVSRTGRLSQQCCSKNGLPAFTRRYLALPCPPHLHTDPLPALPTAATAAGAAIAGLGSRAAGEGAAPGKPDALHLLTGLLQQKQVRPLCGLCCKRQLKHHLLAHPVWLYARFHKTCGTLHTAKLMCSLCLNSCVVLSGHWQGRSLRGRNRAKGYTAQPYSTKFNL